MKISNCLLIELTQHSEVGVTGITKLKNDEIRENELKKRNIFNE